MQHKGKSSLGKPRVASQSVRSLVEQKKPGSSLKKSREKTGEWRKASRRTTLETLY